MSIHLDGLPFSGARENRLLWIAAGVGLVVLVLILSIFAGPRGVPQSSPAGASSAAASASASPALSAAEAARRAAIAQLGPIKHPEGTNAAEMYHQANELYKQLSADDKKALRDMNKDLDPKRVADLTAKIQPIMQLLRDARTANYVDWGPDDFSTAQGQKRAEANGTVLALSRVARWDATYHLDSDPELAIGDLAAADAMASNNSIDPTAYTISCSVHEDGLAVLEQSAGALSSLSAQDAALISDNTWISQDFKSMADSGASVYQNLLDQYLDPATRDQAAKVTSEPFLSGTVPGAAPNAQGLVAELQWAVQALQHYAGSVQEPTAEFQQWSAQMKAESASMPIGDVFYGNYDYFQMNRTYAESATVQYAMIAAGIALQQGNQAQFQSIADPATGQPFTVIQTAGGFQLSSPFKNYAGEQLIIPFGAPPAK
jgi:hypothetical protein